MLAIVLANSHVVINRQCEPTVGWLSVDVFANLITNDWSGVDFLT